MEKIKGFIRRNTQKMHGVIQNVTPFINAKVEKGQSSYYYTKKQIDEFRAEDRLAWETEDQELLLLINKSGHTIQTHYENDVLTINLYDKNNNLISSASETIESEGKFINRGEWYSDTNSIILYYNDDTHISVDLSELVNSLSNRISTIENDYLKESDKNALEAEIQSVADNLQSHESNKNNPHEVTKAQVGLGAVENYGQTSNTSENSNLYFTSGGAYTLKVSLSQAITDEANTRSSSDSQLQTNIDNEVTARANADTALDGKITQETTRATNSETALSNRITNIDNVISEGTSTDNKLVNQGSMEDYVEAHGGKINTLSIVGNDATPLPIVSKNVELPVVRTDTNAQGLTSTQQTNVKTNIGLNNVINTADSATPIENGTTKFTTGGAYTMYQQLFTLIKTQAAHYRGSWDTWNDVPTDPSLYPADTEGDTTPTANDYMIVSDASGYPVAQGEPSLSGPWRFIYTGDWATDGKNGWKNAYAIDAELAAILDSIANLPTDETGLIKLINGTASLDKNTYLTDITSSMIITALGYTPADVNNIPPTIVINTTNHTISDGTTTMSFGSNAYTDTLIPVVYIEDAAANGNTLTVTKADGTSFSYTPTFTDTNTWRPIQVAGVEYQGSAINTQPINFKNDGNVQFTFIDSAAAPSTIDGKIGIKANVNLSAYALETNNAFYYNSDTERYEGKGNINLGEGGSVYFDYADTYNIDYSGDIPVISTESLKDVLDSKANVSDIPTNYVTTDTAQTIGATKTLNNDSSIIFTYTNSSNPVYGGIKAKFILNDYDILKPTFVQQGYGGYMVTDISAYTEDSNSFIRFNSNVQPASNNTLNLGGISSYFAHIYGVNLHGTNLLLSGIMKNGSGNYGIAIPTTTSYTANKTLATLDDIPTITIDTTNNSISDGTTTMTFGSNAFNSDVYYLASNPNGYITGITSTDVTTALGYTPANDADIPTNYVTTDTAQTISATKTFGANIELNNNVFVKGYTTANTIRSLIGVNSSSVIALGDNSANINVYCSSTFRPAADNSKDLGTSSLRWKNLFLGGFIGSSANASYGLTLPSTSGWTANKTIATTSDLSNLVSASASGNTLTLTPYGGGTATTYTPSVGVTSVTIQTSGTGISGGSSTAITSTGTRTITLDSSSAGNAAANKVVLRNATGTIQSDTFAISSSGTTKANISYDSTNECIKFTF